MVLCLETDGHCYRGHEATFLRWESVCQSGLFFTVRVDLCSSKSSNIFRASPSIDARTSPRPSFPRPHTNSNPDASEVPSTSPRSGRDTIFSRLMIGSFVCCYYRCPNSISMQHFILHLFGRVVRPPICFVYDGRLAHAVEADLYVFINSYIF